MRRCAAFVDCPCPELRTAACWHERFLAAGDDDHRAPRVPGSRLPHLRHLHHPALLRRRLWRRSEDSHQPHCCGHFVYVEPHLRLGSFECRSILSVNRIQKLTQRNPVRRCAAFCERHKCPNGSQDSNYFHSGEGFVAVCDRRRGDGKTGSR